MQFVEALVTFVCGKRITSEGRLTANGKVSRFWRTMYAVSQKNIPDIFSCNSRKRRRIFVMFGTHVTEKVSIRRCYSFPPHLTSVSALPEKMQ